MFRIRETGGEQGFAGGVLQLTAGADTGSVKNARDSAATPVVVGLLQGQDMESGGEELGDPVVGEPAQQNHQTDDRIIRQTGLQSVESAVASEGGKSSGKADDDQARKAGGNGCHAGADDEATDRAVFGAVEELEGNHQTDEDKAGHELEDRHRGRIADEEFVSGLRRDPRSEGGEGVAKEGGNQIFEDCFHGIIGTSRRHELKRMRSRQPGFRRK